MLDSRLQIMRLGESNIRHFEDSAESVFLFYCAASILLCENVADIIWMPRTVVAQGFAAAISLTCLQTQWRLERWLRLRARNRAYTRARTVKKKKEIKRKEN